MNKLGVLVTAAATCLFFQGGAANTCWEEESSTDTCTEGCWFDDGWTYDTCETCSSGSDDPNNECDIGQQSGYSPNCYVMDSSSVGCCSGFRESGVSINGVVQCIRNGMDDQLNGGTRDGLYCGSQSSFTNVCNTPSAPASSSSSPSEETCWEQESSTDTCPEGCWFDDGWTYDTCETCSSGSEDPDDDCDVGQRSGYSPNCYVRDSSSVGCCSGFRKSGTIINGVEDCIRNGMDNTLIGGKRDGLYCGSQSSFANVCNMPSAPASSSSPSPSSSNIFSYSCNNGANPLLNGCCADNNSCPSSCSYSAQSINNGVAGCTCLSCSSMVLASSSPSPSPYHESNIFSYSCNNGANPLLNGCCADNNFCPSSCSNSASNSYNGVATCTCSSCSSNHNDDDDDWGYQYEYDSSGSGLHAPGVLLLAAGGAAIAASA